MSILNGVEFTRTGNPVEDLKNYATARGINEAEAKKELEAEFGIPEQINNSKDEGNIQLEENSINISTTKSLFEFFKGLIAKLFGNTATKNENAQTVTIDGQTFELSGDPEVDAQNVADKLNITLDEAKEKLEAKLGKPKQPQKNTSTNTTSTADKTTSTDKTTTDDNDSSTTTSSSTTTKTGSCSSSSKNETQQEAANCYQALQAAVARGDKNAIKIAEARYHKAKHNAEQYGTIKQGHYV